MPHISRVPALILSSAHCVTGVLYFLCPCGVPLGSPVPYNPLDESVNSDHMLPEDKFFNIYVNVNVFPLFSVLLKTEHVVYDK